MRHFKGISQLILVLAILFAGFQFQPASAADYEVLVLYPSGPFNAKIPANATYTPETRIGVVKHSLEAWSTTIYRVNSGVNVPLVKITNYFSGRVENWPIPTYAMPSTGDDRSMVVFHYGSGYSYEFWDAKWVNSTTMTAGGMVKFPLNGTGIGTKNQRVSASGFAASAGMIVMEDFYNPVTGKIDPNGRIDHALTASLPASVITSGYVSPAVGGESSGKAGAGGIDVGMRFTLPRDLNVDALNIHPLTREILRAIRDYGLYINDGNGTPAYNGKAIATPRIEPGLSEILYGVPSDNLVNRLTTETYAVIQQYGLYRVTGGSGTTPPTNTAPGVSVSQGTVTVNEGQNATINGAVGDKEGGALTMSASVGTVTNNNNGTWTWQMPTHDGPAQSQTVTVRATDSQGAVGQVTFNVSVQNVAPTGTLTLSIAQPKTGESTRVSFTGVTDPGSSDTTAGFTFRYDCKNDGTYEKTGASTTCTYTNPGTYTIKAQIVDKDNGAQTYTQSVTVGAASTVTPTPTTTTPTPTPTQTKTPTPTATTPVPTQTKTPTPTATTPVPTQTKTPTPPPTGSANPADFVLLGQEGIWVEKSSQILSGHVGANSEVALDSEVRVPNSSVFGDTLTFRNGVRVLNAYGNTITGGRVTGQKGKPTLPLVTMPPFPTFTATDDQIVVDYDQKLTLDAGTYGELEVRDDAEVIFTGGVYTFNRVEAWWAGTFTFLAPTEIRVTGQVKLNGYTKVLPAAGVNPSQVVWFVAGQNDTNNPSTIPTAVQIGNNTVINANFYAPNGTIYLNNRTQATGAFIGRWVRIGQRVQLNHASAFGAPMDFAAYNQNSVSPATVAAPQMQVAFTPDVISGTAPLTVTFANHSTGDILTQVWDFGDTTVSEEVSPAHTFTVAGEYTVTLTTMATDGTTQIAQTVISVAAPAPVYVAPTASFVTNVTEGVVPLTVNFTNLSTGDIQSVVWDFGDGTTSAENNPIRTFTAVGQYVVRLTVTGMDGSQQGTEVTINATQPVAAPTAAFVTDILTGTVPLTVQFTNQSTGDIAGYWWDFGDGASSSDANPAYTYLNAGQYTVTLTVTGVDGSIQVAQTVISASDPAPVYVAPTAAFAASAIDGVAPLAVQFTNQSTGDIASYWWDFGDGASSSDANPAYTYLNAGQYTVTLTVTGLDGSFQTAQLLINVQPTPQTAAPEVPQFAVPLECQHIVFSGAPIINGDGNDWIYGTEGNDLIYAGNGHNVVFGYGGDDCIIAADGHDTVEGGAGNDVIFGDGGSDDMYGDAGDDLLIGGDVSDAYYGGEGNDTSRTYDPNIDWMHDSIEVTQ